MAKQLTVFIPMGEQLSFTTDAFTSGAYVRLSNPGGSQNTPTAFVASTSYTIGPFNEPRDYRFDYNGTDLVVTSSYSGIVTAADDTALTLLAPKASPTFTGTVTLPSTTSIGSVSSTEVGYLDGVNAALQTQLDSKGAKVVTPVAIPGDQAINFTANTYIAKLTKGSVAAVTLAAPTDGVHDGSILIITSTTDFAHVVTATDSILDGVTGGAKDTMTFEAFAGASITLMAIGTKWYVVSKNGVTVAGA